MEKLLDPAIKVKKETLIASRKAFESALKDLNKCHTIWRCRSEDIGVDVSEDYSTSWLEKVWHHHCDLDDELDELIYTFDDSSVTLVGSLNACSSTSDEVRINVVFWVGPFSGLGWVLRYVCDCHHS